MTPIHHLLRTRWAGFYRLCNHRSHRLRLPCFRWHALDGQCGKHVGSCYHFCERVPVADRYGTPSRWQWFRADLWALVTPLLRCVHRSHRLGLPCLRHFAYGRLCRMHGMCDFECPRETRRG